MAVRVGINGFGSIGRRFLRVVLGHPQIEVRHINDLTAPALSAHLLKYDSNYGTLAAMVTADATGITIDGRTIPVSAEPRPDLIPWRQSGVDVVIEATGRFTGAGAAGSHITAGGARRVIVTAPSPDADLTVVMGVNHDQYVPERHRLISMASCTTNCLALVARVLDDHFGIEQGLLNTVHAYTNDQVLLDFPHKDRRRARAAGLSIIPTGTGAARAVVQVLPHLAGKLTGLALRVPTPTVSVVDFTANLARPATAEQVNATFRAAAADDPAGALAYSEAELVSVDFKGHPASCIIDAPSTVAIGNLVKVIAWYDNEWGYSSRLADLVTLVGQADI